MIKLLINGINGKMGQEVLKSSEKAGDFEIVGKVDKNIKDIKEKPDVIIDFSTPEGTMEILEYATFNKITIVIPTTGFNKDNIDYIEKCSNTIPVFKSSNMSYEVNVLCDIVKLLAQKLEYCDIEIVETHHNQKKDSPSGTALMLANSINSVFEDELEYVYDRHTIKTARSNKEIGIHSIRGGTETGKHTILFMSENETLEITHSTSSRSVFANGALKAARFIVNQKNGLYDMSDLIK